MLGEVVGQRFDFGLLEVRAVLYHRDDDVAPLRAVVVATKLRHLGELVARGAAGLQDLLALAVRQVFAGTWRLGRCAGGDKAREEKDRRRTQKKCHALYFTNAIGSPRDPETDSARALCGDTPRRMTRPFQASRQSFARPSGHGDIAIPQSLRRDPRGARRCPASWRPAGTHPRGCPGSPVTL